MRYERQHTGAQQKDQADCGSQTCGPRAFLPGQGEQRKSGGQADRDDRPGQGGEPLLDGAIDVLTTGSFPAHRAVVVSRQATQRQGHSRHQTCQHHPGQCGHHRDQELGPRQMIPHRGQNGGQHTDSAAHQDRSLF